MKIYKYFFKTIYDIGFIRIIGRLEYELKKLIYGFLPGKLNLLISNSNQKHPYYQNTLTNLESKKLPIRNYPLINKSFTFNFLNEKKSLNFPINWNSAEFSHLWRFNLHYFDWARLLIENEFSKENFNREIAYLDYLINDWIDNNVPGYGDGWSSYTISLRIRNWILIFRSCPNLVNEKYINSLWKQICWLFCNKEMYLGGNHWIENLVSLIIGSLQFEGKKARNIYQYAMSKLEEELKKQILSDGGHIERSASYHLLILDRLVELGLIIENIEGTRPLWLIDSILKMRDWALSIKLINGEYPKFNDNINLNFSIDSIIYYASSYLKQSLIKEESIKNRLSKIYKKKNFEKTDCLKKNKKNSVTNLFNTGWIIGRVNNNVEVIFKVGKSCPKYLPAHGHSDLLSFELFSKGVPLIVETGTSIYGNNKKRYYERSGGAHNILQLAPFKKKDQGLIEWIEPIEVWGNFRAARKAKVIERVGMILEDGTIFMKGSNDANLSYGATYTRIIKLKEIEGKDVLLEVIDEINCKKKMYWRQFWHIGPEQTLEFIMPIVFELRKKYIFKEKFLDTWIAKEFGKTEERKTLQLSGIIEPGFHTFNNQLVIRN